jgi:phosphatidylserine decarboxylase
MRIDPAGWPFVIGGLVIAIVAAFFAGWPFGLILLGLTAFFLFFFRDPERIVQVAANAVVSPADGRVMVAGPATAQGFPPDRWQQISIFLSPMDVHVNRMPVSGRVEKVEYHPGRFLPAYKAEAADLNEYTEVVVDHDGQKIVVRQIVGILARRIVCRVREAAQVRAGERFGVMKFGSRMDVFLPGDATLSTRVGDKVVGGVTILATLREGASHASRRD